MDISHSCQRASVVAAIKQQRHSIMCSLRVPSGPCTWCKASRHQSQTKQGCRKRLYISEAARRSWQTAQVARQTILPGRWCCLYTRARGPTRPSQTALVAPLSRSRQPDWWVKTPPGRTAPWAQRCAMTDQASIGPARRTSSATPCQLSDQQLPYVKSAMSWREFGDPTRPRSVAGRGHRQCPWLSISWHWWPTSGDQRAHAQPFWKAAGLHVPLDTRGATTALTLGQHRFVKRMPARVTVLVWF